MNRRADLHNKQPGCFLKLLTGFVAHLKPLKVRVSPVLNLQRWKTFLHIWGRGRLSFPFSLKGAHAPLCHRIAAACWSRERICVQICYFVQIVQPTLLKELVWKKKKEKNLTNRSGSRSAFQALTGYNGDKRNHINLLWEVGQRTMSEPTAKDRTHQNKYHSTGTAALSHSRPPAHVPYYASKTATWTSWDLGGEIKQREEKRTRAVQKTENWKDWIFYY